MLTISRLVTFLAAIILLIFCIIIGTTDAGNYNENNTVINEATIDTINIDDVEIDTIVVEGKVAKLNDDRVLYRLYPEGRKVQLSFEHEIWLERDTVIAKHWHPATKGWYVILTDGTDLYCDAVREIR